MIGDLRRYAAVNARVRALLGTQLGRSGLEALYSYPNTQAILDALLRTPYGASFAPGPAEPGLSGRLALVGKALLDLVPPTERAFLHEYLLRHEIENVKLLIRAVSNHLAWEVVAPYVVALPGVATVDPKALADAHNLRELAERLGGTAYGRPIHAALHRAEEAGPFALEVALELDYYERLWMLAGALARSDAERARRLLGVLFDVLNLNWIARYRDAHVLAPEEILNYTLRQGRWITLELRRSLAEDPRQPWHLALARTPYAPLVAATEERGFDAVAASLWRFLAAEAQRSLAGYPFHIAVPLGFLLVQEIEIRDVHVLLAAKSIGAPTAEALEHIATVRH